MSNDPDEFKSFDVQGRRKPAGLIEGLQKASIASMLEASDQRARQAIAGAIGSVIGFSLGYLTWAIWPLSNLVYKLFTECFL